MANPERIYTRQDKYASVAGFLKDKSGTLLDVGARNRILGSMLNRERLSYFSADLDQGHDLYLNLEEPLPLQDAAYDFVTALDVLEHIEQIHSAFHELARITRQTLIIALPNMSTWPRRWSFLRHGHLRTGKYDLLPEHQLDRHRWLTTYAEINEFIAANAKLDGFTVTTVIEELEPGSIVNRVASAGTSLGFFPNGGFTGRCIYFLNRTA